MNDDQHRIRELITDWSTAVRDGDLAGVLADHAEDIVMFDVPPPHEGVRGLDAYRGTWPPFFEWQRRAGSSKSPSSRSRPARRSPSPGRS